MSNEHKHTPNEHGVCIDCASERAFEIAEEKARWWSNDENKNKKKMIEYYHQEYRAMTQP